MDFRCEGAHLSDLDAVSWPRHRQGHACRSEAAENPVAPLPGQGCGAASANGCCAGFCNVDTRTRRTAEFARSRQPLMFSRAAANQKPRIGAGLCMFCQAMM